REWCADFIINADHLLRMPLLRSPDVALFDGAGSVRIAEYRFIIDTQVHERSADPFAVGIGPDQAGQGHTRTQSAQQGGHAAGAAESFLALIGVQKNDRRFLTDALGIAPDIAVEHDIANHENARLAEVAYEVRKLARHGDLLIAQRRFADAWSCVTPRV